MKTTDRAPRLTLTYEQALESLQAVATAHPERTIEDMGGVCTYFFRRGDAEKVNRKRRLPEPVAAGQPNCIVGHVLAAHGVTIEDMSGWGSVWMGDGGSANAGSNVTDLVQRGFLDVPPDAHRLLQVAQEQQDGGIPWGECLQAGVVAVASHTGLDTNPVPA